MDTLPENSQAQSNTDAPFRHRLAVFLATGGGVGFIPFAPGTFGALWGLLLAWGVGLSGSIAAQVVAIVAFGVAGVPICEAAAQRLGKKDPGAVVWDEIASMPITFFLVPPAGMQNLAVLALGFALNRLFDIVKPPPVRQFERLRGGLGIMADDWAAGVYSCVVLHLLLWASPWDWIGG